MEIEGMGVIERWKLWWQKMGPLQRQDLLVSWLIIFCLGMAAGAILIKFAPKEG